ncbi:Elongation factor 1-beta [Phytophthora boehmeriae]|uniref:RxLR effector protein n=1 Tax=Phytophthora boehmeriae TaxID=109152 RepID=A0A8T1WW32_9STRA|nr:Elongation factor 1-beta [Phytophthora boehmeriae]
MRSVFYVAVAVAVAVFARSSVVAAFANADESKLLSKATPDFTADAVISGNSRKRFLRVTEPEDEDLLAADEERVKLKSLKKIAKKLDKKNMKQVAWISKGPRRTRTKKDESIVFNDSGKKLKAINDRFAFLEQNVHPPALADLLGLQTRRPACHRPAAAPAKKAAPAAKDDDEDNDDDDKDDDALAAKCAEAAKAAKKGEKKLVERSQKVLECVIVDDLVLLDDITEPIEQFEDYYTCSSVDVASMNKL